MNELAPYGIAHNIVKGISHLDIPLGSKTEERIDNMFEQKRLKKLQRK